MAHLQVFAANVGDQFLDVNAFRVFAEYNLQCCFMKSSTHCSWELYVLSFLGHHSSVSFSLVVCRSLEFEVIVIDDNSPDGTQDVVKKLQKLYGAQQLVSSPCHPYLLIHQRTRQDLEWFSSSQPTGAYQQTLAYTTPISLHI